MKIFVNEKEFTLFEGATVADALHMYSNTALSDVKAQQAIVLDAYGNTISPEGALHEGARLFLRVNNNKPKV